MLSTKECREHLGDIHLTDAQIERLQGALYALVENLLDDYIKSSATVESCKKQLSTVESPLNDRKMKVMD